MYTAGIFNIHIPYHHLNILVNYKNNTQSGANLDGQKLSFDDERNGTNKCTNHLYYKTLP